MRYVAFFSAVVVLLGFSGLAGAYTYGPDGQGNPYWCPAIPDEYIPTMDGNLNDWAWLPSKWVFDVESTVVNGLHGTPIGLETWTRDDFDAQVYGPCWIPSTNMYAFAAHKVDDVWWQPAEGVYESHVGDALQFNNDPDGSGGDTDGVNAQQAFFTMMDGGFIGCYQQPDGVPIRHAYEDPNCFWAAEMDIATGSYDFEIMLYLWDELYPLEEESLQHVFEPGQSMGIGMWIPDRDDTESTISIGWHFASPNTADGFARLEIMPVEETYKAIEEEPMAVESTTWGAVKALLR